MGIPGPEPDFLLLLLLDILGSGQKSKKSRPLLESLHKQGCLRKTAKQTGFTKSHHIAMPDGFVRKERIRRAFLGTCVCSAVHKITIRDGSTQHKKNTIQCRTIQQNAIQYKTTQYEATQYDTVPYHTTQCDTIQHNTIAYNTAD